MLNKEKGITLIALIITIIVMLILVGVTINVALNGGMFTKAEDAASGTEKQAIYEQIVSNMELTNDGKISVKGTFDKVVAELGADKVTNINPATVDENTTEVTFSVVGKTGTYNYKISTTEIEKDPVQTLGELVYGKLYDAGEIGFCFSENYNRVMVPGDIETFWGQYSYDKENRIVNITATEGDGELELELTLSENGNTLLGNVNGVEMEFNLTDTNLFEQYNPQTFTKNNVESYFGMYYNSTVDKFIYLIDAEGVAIVYSIIEEERK